MHLDLLTKNAEIINGGKPTNNELNDEFRLFPNMNFTCSGRINGLLLRADIRRSNNFRYQYPLIQLWRKNNGDQFNRVASQEIRLAEGDFSPDGVLQYTLTTPIWFQSGDVLGVYQPGSGNSVVQLYFIADNSAPDSFRFQGNPSTEIALRNTSRIWNQNILLTPITSNENK